MKSLREGYLIGTLDKQIKERTAEASKLALEGSTAKKVREDKGSEEVTSRQRKEAALGWTAFYELTIKEQESFRQEFCKLPTTPMLARRLSLDTAELINHLTDPAISTSFGCFVANKVHSAAKASKGAKSLNLFSEK